MKKIFKIVAGISVISAFAGAVAYFVHKKQDTTEI